MMLSFREKLQRSIENVGNFYCVGIDPHPNKSFSFLYTELQKKGPEQFLKTFSKIHIDVSKENVGSVKFQSAFFEQFGQSGFLALHDSFNYAKKNGLFTILDAKRCDISSTMSAYGKMAFDVFSADAVTVVPYMGFDCINALDPWLKNGSGVYVVLISSNESGRSIQNAPVSSGSFAEFLFDLFSSDIKKFSLLNSVGFVVGATKIDEICASFTEKIKAFPLLLPGLGAQGATLTPILKSFVNTAKESLFPVSRSISGLSFDENITSSINSWSNYREFLEENLKKLLSS